MPAYKVKALTGRIININFEVTDKVLAVKQKLNEVEGIDVEQIRLICKGQQM